jgi:hypothetical protein
MPGAFVLEQNTKNTYVKQTAAGHRSGAARFYEQDKTAADGGYPK